MFDFLLNDEQKALREEARDLVRWVPRQMILDMDAEKIKFPKDFLKEAGRRNLFGCRYPASLGGREMDWVTSCMLLALRSLMNLLFRSRDTMLTELAGF